MNKITNDSREDEMEQNLSEVSNAVGCLRDMAVQIGNQVNSHNRQLDRIQAKTEANAVSVKEAEARASKLI